jgi:hypothetical protein
MDYFRYIMEVVGTGVDGIGVFVIIGGALLARRAADFLLLLVIDMLST